MLACALAGGCGDDASEASRDGGGQGSSSDAGEDAAQASNADAGSDAAQAAGKDSGADASSDPDEDASTDLDAAVDGGGEHLAEEVVGASGGTVTASNGVSLEIPADALPSNVTITIDEIQDADPPEDATSLGKTYELGPEGLTFDQPVKVTLP